MSKAGGGAAASRVSQIPRARKNRGNSLPRDSGGNGHLRSQIPEPKKATGDRQSTTNSLQPSSKSHSALTVNEPTASNPNLLENENVNLPSTVITKVMRQLSTKKREFMKMKKQLIVQQNALLTNYASLKELEMRGGGGCGPGTSLDETLGTIRIVSVNGWPAHDLMLIIRDDLAKPINFDVDSIIAPQVFEQLVAQLSAIPDEVTALGEELIASHLQEAGSQRSLKQREWKNNKGSDDVEEKLHGKVQAVVQNLHAKILYALQLAKTPWVDRDTLVKKAEKYQKENLLLHHKLEEVKEKEEQINYDLNKHTCQSNHTELNEELQKERAAREALNEVVGTAEGMLRVARARITTLERQLKEMKAQLDASHRKQKDLELLYRHRESSYDARSKKLLEVSKTGEITIETLTRQREALEQRVKELQEKLHTQEEEHEAQANELRGRIASLQGKLAVQKKGKEVTEVTVTNMETHIKDLEAQLAAVKQRSEKLIALEQMRCLDFIPSKEAEPKERETELWRELQETRACLAKTNEDLRKSKLDKEDFLTSLSRIAQCGDDASLHDKMATKLIEGEKKIIKLQEVIKELEEKIKNADQSKQTYESKLSEMRMEIKRLKYYDNYGKDIPHQELQSELLDLQTTVQKLTAERNRLARAAASSALLLERHERAAELFARVTRARRDLAALVEPRAEPPPLDDAARVEMTKSLTTFCASSSEKWSALLAERERVLFLERAVTSQNQQLEREGCVRTQLERRRAALEREILRSQYRQAGSSMSSCSDARLIMPPAKNYYV